MRTWTLRKKTAATTTTTSLTTTTTAAAAPFTAEHHCTMKLKASRFDFCRRESPGFCDGRTKCPSFCLSVRLTDWLLTQHPFVGVSEHACNAQCAPLTSLKGFCKIWFVIRTSSHSANTKTLKITTKSFWKITKLVQPYMIRCSKVLCNFTQNQKKDRKIYNLVLSVSFELQG